MKYAKREKTGKKQVVLTVVCAVLALILALMIAVTIFLKDFLSGINRLSETSPTLSQQEIESILKQTESPDPEFTGPVLKDEDVTMPTGPAQTIVSSKNVINFLLVGQDRREGSPRMHSDAMILVTINKSKKTLTMTSFMRDLWVKIPGYFNERLHVPYFIDPTNGFNLLNETLEYHFGVSGDHNVEVEFSGFKAAIEAVGGVTIKLTDAEAKHLNSQNSSWALVEGDNHLDGEQALAYSRIRKIGNDFSRTSRQRTVLLALMEKAKTLSVTELYNLAKSVMPMITTDMTDAQILGYVLELAPLLPELTVVSQRIPTDNAYYDANINGNMVLCLSESNWETNLQLLRDTLGE